MVAALGVNQKWLFTSVFALGVVPGRRSAARCRSRARRCNHAMDLRIIVDVFVVVVIGGLGSIVGAFVAAVLVSRAERLRHPDLSEDLASSWCSW